MNPGNPFCHNDPGFITKATALGSLVTGLPPLMNESTAVVFAQNGIPWWYDIGLPSDHPTPPDLGFLDPGGKLRAAVPKPRIIGGVIFSSNEVVEPGVVAHIFQNGQHFQALVQNSKNSTPYGGVKEVRVASFPSFSAHRALEFVELKRAKKLFAPEPDLLRAAHK